MSGTLGEGEHQGCNLAGVFRGLSMQGETGLPGTSFWRIAWGERPKASVSWLQAQTTAELARIVGKSPHVVEL